MAGRGLSATTKAEIAKKQLTIAFLIKLEFDGGDLTVWTGIGDLLYSGDTYLGAGQAISLEALKETIDERAQGYRLGLSGVPSANIALALDEQYQGRPGSVSMGFFNNADSGSLIDNPVVLFSGEMDVMNIFDNGKTSTITVNLESKMIRLNTPKESRYTHSEQLSRYPQDQAFLYIAQIANESIYWGDVSQSR